MEEIYLDIKELCSRIKYKPQTIYNKIHQGVFVEGTDYIKPMGKLLFKWSGIRRRLGDTDNYEHAAPLAASKTMKKDKRPKSLITL